MSQVWMSMGPLPSYAFMPENELAAMLLSRSRPDPGSGIFVAFLATRQPQGQKPEADCHAREKGPEPGEPFRVGELLGIRNVTERRKSRDGNAKAQDRENGGHDHGRLQREFQMRLRRSARIPRRDD